MKKRKKLFSKRSFTIKRFNVVDFIDGGNFIVFGDNRIEWLCRTDCYFGYCHMTAFQFAQYKRGHWSVENSLHWVLDMVFREDESRARVEFNSAENLNVIRQIAFNILKCETSFMGGISDKQFNCLLDERYLEKVVRSWLCS